MYLSISLSLVMLSASFVFALPSINNPYPEGALVARQSPGGSQVSILATAHHPHHLNILTTRAPYSPGRQRTTGPTYGSSTPQTGATPGGSATRNVRFQLHSDCSSSSSFKHTYDPCAILTWSPAYNPPNSQIIDTPNWRNSRRIRD